MVRIGPVDVGAYPLLLAPMEDVSDPPFRVLCKAFGASVVYTEFISADGLIRFADKSVQKLDVYDEERPVGIQIFGHDIEAMRICTQIVERAEPEILDINFGCPVKKVTCKGAGAAILLDIPKMELLTREIVRMTHLPVTVKTRLGWDENTIRIREVALRLQDAGIKALTIHGRTRQQMYKGEADWTLIQEVAADPGIEIPIFGNGDVDSPAKALEMRQRYPDISGIMIGRAAIGNPWVFGQIRHYLDTGVLLPEPSLAERVDVCRRHLMMSVIWKGERQALHEMRRHYTAYFKGLPGFKPLRVRLVTSENLNEILDILDLIESDYCQEEERQPALAHAGQVQIRTAKQIFSNLDIDTTQESAEPYDCVETCA
ncbi:MAG: tRNA dihydrouridine synthase DusB [Bacteroidia bacterium]